MEPLIFNSIKVQRNFSSMIFSSRKIHQALSRKTNTKKEWKNVGVRGLLLLSIPIGTFCLGSWQVSRRKWKLQLIEDLENLMKQAPIYFPENLQDINNLEYRKVKIYGEFDHSREVYLGPRSKIVKGDAEQVGGGLLSTGQSGYNVITPFTLADSELTILVNRGWVPRKCMNPLQRQEGQVSGPVSLTGVIRKHERRAVFMPETQKNSTLFSYRDVLKMAEMTDSSPIYVDAVETFDGGPKGSQTRVTLRNEHFSYILTWYTLSLFTSLMWYQKFVAGKVI